MGKGKPRDADTVVEWQDKHGRVRESSMTFFRKYQWMTGGTILRKWSARTGESFTV